MLDGHVLWETADPDGGAASGPVTIANGIVYAPSTSGHLHLLDASNGHILRSFSFGNDVHGGASVVDGRVYVGSGYQGSPGSLNAIALLH